MASGPEARAHAGWMISRASSAAIAGCGKGWNAVLSGRGQRPRARNPGTLTREIKGLGCVHGFRARPPRGIPERQRSFHHPVREGAPHVGTWPEGDDWFEVADGCLAGARLTRLPGAAITAIDPNRSLFKLAPSKDWSASPLQRTPCEPEYLFGGGGC